jgi:hypothetical protein
MGRAIMGTRVAWNDRAHGNGIDSLRGRRIKRLWLATPPAGRMLV